MRKNNLLGVMFSFLPGAGHMYLGMMKKGTALMSVFFGVMFVSAFSRWDLVMVALPVVWFYSFFDAMNLRQMTWEAQQANEERFMEMLRSLGGKDWKALVERRHKIFGWALVGLGIMLTVDSFLSPLLGYFSEYYPHLYFLISGIPTLLVSIVIIWLGIYLIRGKRPAQEERDFIEFGGKDHE